MTTRRTVVRNHGNMNKGGSKTIFKYGSDGALQSTTNIRGSLNNKRGGVDNQYSVNTNSTSSPKASSSNYKGSASVGVANRSDNADSSAGLVGLILGGAFFLIVFLYNAISWIAHLFVSGFSALFHMLF